MHTGWLILIFFVGLIVWFVVKIAGHIRAGKVQGVQTCHVQTRHVQTRHVPKEPPSDERVEAVPHLIFKSREDFFWMQCKYGHTKIQPNQGIVALVLDASKEFGQATAVKIEDDGRQKAMIKVPSQDGGFIVIAETPTGKGDRLKPDDVVIWVPLKQVKMPEGIDERFGWVGFIVAKVEPDEQDIANPNDFKIICKYE